MINWAEKQAPEDRQVNWRTYWTRATQYGVEEPREAFVEFEDDKAQRDNLELLKWYDHSREWTTWTKPRRPQRLKELSRERRTTSCKVRKTLHDGRKPDSRGVRKRDAPCGQRPQGNASEAEQSAGDHKKTRKRQGRAPLE